MSGKRSASTVLGLVLALATGFSPSPVYSSQDKAKQPVADGVVHLVQGDHYGIKVAVTNDEISGVTYEPTVKNSDLEFTFKAEGDKMTILVIENHLKRTVYMDATMTIPGKQGTFKTSIVPIEGGLSDFESWPHPITELQLRNIRFSAKPRAS